MCDNMHLSEPHCGGLLSTHPDFLVNLERKIGVEKGSRREIKVRERTRSTPSPAKFWLCLVS